MSSTTITQTEKVHEPEYVYYFYDGAWGAKREVLTGAQAKETFSQIPIIDISRIYSEKLEERASLAQEIATACEKVGFFYIKEHGIPEELINATMDSTKKYFDQPTEVKMQEHIYLSRNLRGYEPVHGAQLDTATPLGDRKESFLYNYEPENDPQVPTLTEAQRSLLSHNLWPQNQPDFKRECFAYDKAMIVLARKMMQCFALGLGADEHYFDDMITAPNTSVKKIHYPPQDPSSTSETGIGAHTDFVCFTMLYQDSVGGLDVLNANGKWIPAPPVPGTFVVNIGDFLMRASNDKFLSTVHRVKNISGQERYSMPFFFSFNMDAYVEVLPTCCSETNPRKYEPITVAEYYRLRHEKQRKKFMERGIGQ
ncbi:oxoglutarate oxygenase [Coleophoma crateriformis]|uniref:Oxoglutarate oxygenase n=1 Tax=Coleophoma crateriformis TaxID=565419 RepID=A0A3D8QCT3_9HELO|nr:oxoglutarate oxygenase [Coleophoma crateriformis]